MLHALDRLIPDKTLQTNLPAQGVVTLQDQKEEKRLVNHLLYATPVRRGRNIEVIEDIISLYDVQVPVQTSHHVKNVYMAPQMTALHFTYKDQTVVYKVPRLECHQMVVIEYEASLEEEQVH